MRRRDARSEAGWRQKCGIGSRGRVNQLKPTTCKSLAHRVDHVSGQGADVTWSREDGLHSSGIVISGLDVPRRLTCVVG